MPRAKRQASNETETPALRVVEAPAAPAIPGYVPGKSWRRFDCDWLEPADGAEGFWAEIETSLTFDELDALPKLDGTATYADVFAAVAPRVRAWNAVGFDEVSQSWVPVAPPAEGGVASLRAIPPGLVNWLLVTVRGAVFGGPERTKR